MSSLVACFTAFACLGLGGLPLWAQQPTESARDLVRDVMYNELHDREPESHWAYRSQIVSTSKNQVREQIETDQGPIFRVIEENGAPLDAEQRDREARRLNEYIHDPMQIERVRRAHEEDEERLTEMMQIMPQAFLFGYLGHPAGDVVRISFRPDPAFVPSGYEARIVHALCGTITVNLREKRLIDMRGALGQRIDFGYGLLGHAEKGSSFEIHREQVSPRQWKADLVEVHIEGKLLMLKSISKDQREVRSDFRPVRGGASLAEAKQMLSRSDAGAGQDEAQIAAAAGNRETVR